MPKLRQSVIENFRISLHYKAGMAKVAMQSADSLLVVHCYCTQVEDMGEAFILHQAYSRFLERHHVSALLTVAISEDYGVDMVGSYLNEAISEIQMAVQQMKEGASR